MRVVGRVNKGPLSHTVGHPKDPQSINLLRTVWKGIGKVLYNAGLIAKGTLGNLTLLLNLVNMPAILVVRKYQFDE